GLDRWCQMVRDAAAKPAGDPAGWTELAVRLLRSGLDEGRPLVRAARRRARSLGLDVPADDVLVRLANDAGPLTLRSRAEASSAAPASPQQFVSDSPTDHEAANAQVRDLLALLSQTEHTLRSLRQSDRALAKSTTWLAAELASARRASEEALALAIRTLE